MSNVRQNKIHHITQSDKNCKICGKPFDFYWFDKDEKNGRSETMWGIDGCHKFCIENKTGVKCKTLQELNEERKHEAH